MKSEIISIGDELLIGQTVNTNAAWIGSELSKLGFEVCQITSIPDRRENILKILSEVTGRVDVVLITGGLGPTSDDITKQTLCEFFNTTLVTNPEVLGMIELMFQRRNLPMNENNRRQAEVPASCRVLYNATGTAPGMWFEKGGTVFVSMPGVPIEMKYIMNAHVLPELSKRFRSSIVIHKNIMTYGTFEARLAEILEKFESELPSNIKLAYLPALGIIKLRLSVSGNNNSKLTNQINEQVKKLYSIIPDYIYGEDEETLEMVVGRILKTKGLTISSAESCTGGMIAHLLTSVPGSSAYFKGSVVAYDNRIKTRLLGVREETLKQSGAVSRETAEEMAEGALKLFNCDLAVASTGIAGPDGGTPEKPVGTVWIAVASEEKTVSKNYHYIHDRVTNIKHFSIAALNLLRISIINM